MSRLAAARSVPDGAGTGPASWFAVAVLVLSTGAFFAVLTPVDNDGSNPLVLMLWVVAYGVAAALLLDRRVRLREGVTWPGELVLFLVLAGSSVVWSVAPELTARRVVGLAGTVLVGLLIGQRLTAVQILDAVRRAVLIVTVASLLLYLSGSPAALDDIHGTLRGVLATKNTLGRVLALGVLAAAATALLDPGKARRCAVSLVPMLAALALTDSTGGVALAAVALLGAGVALVLRGRAGKATVAAAAALLLGVTVLAAPFVSAEQVAGAVGEDTTLTGRDDIWEQALEAVGARPVVGYGYGAFWGATPEAERIRSRLGWEVPHGHNGLLDAGLDLGALGAVASLLVVTGLVARGLADVRRQRGRAVLRLSVAWLIVLSNLVESSLLQQNSLLTLLLVTACAARPDRSEPGATPERQAPGARVAGPWRIPSVESPWADSCQYRAGWSA